MDNKQEQVVINKEDFDTLVNQMKISSRLIDNVLSGHATDDVVLQNDSWRQADGDELNVAKEHLSMAQDILDKNAK